MLYHKMHDFFTYPPHYYCMFKVFAQGYNSKSTLTNEHVYVVLKHRTDVEMLKLVNQCLCHYYYFKKCEYPNIICQQFQTKNV